MSGATGASEILCFLESGAQGHAENDHLACVPLALGAKPAKKRPIKFDIKLGSAIKSTEKQKTDHLHWVTHRGGLGAAH